MYGPINPNDDDEQMQARGDSLRAAMGGPQADLAATRESVQGDLRNGATPSWAMPSTSSAPNLSALSLAMGLGAPGAGAAPQETTRQRARRILSGAPAQASTAPNLSIADAMGVDNLRSTLLAGRDARRNVIPFIPGMSTPPEVADNNLNYLDMLVARSAGSPLGSADAKVDDRRKLVSAMAGYGAANSMDPKQLNRRALIAAMSPITAPDPNDPTKTVTRQPTVEEAMLGYSKAGGTGLTMDAGMRALDSEALANKKGDKGTKAGSLDDLNAIAKGYKDSLANKDYLTAAFFAARHLGTKFDKKDPETGEPMPFSPEMLPGYEAGAAAPPVVNSAPNNAGEAATYKTPEDVRAAFKAGAIDKAAAIGILQKQFGHK